MGLEFSKYLPGTSRWIACLSDQNTTMELILGEAQTTASCVSAADFPESDSIIKIKSGEFRRQQVSRT